MMLRWIATAAIALLFVLNLALPSTDIGRRGNDARARSDVPEAKLRVGDTLPAFRLADLSGRKWCGIGRAGGDSSAAA